jgi:hypothetical protein
VARQGVWKDLLTAVSSGSGMLVLREVTAGIPESQPITEALAN